MTKREKDMQTRGGGCEDFQEIEERVQRSQCSNTKLSSRLGSLGFSSFSLTSTDEEVVVSASSAPLDVAARAGHSHR